LKYSGVDRTASIFSPKCIVFNLDSGSLAD